MTDFLIKSSICLIIFLGFYHLVLEREKIHQFNRFYLLLSILISLVLPFLTFEIIKIIPAVQETEQNLIIPVALEQIPIETIDYTPIILWTLYGLITFALLLRFGKNIWKLVSRSNSNQKVKYKNATLILIDEKTLPHTFLNFIFINLDDYSQRNIEDELYTHELVHVNQKHTLDILFIEFLKTIFWFNPIFIFYKKAIQLNHEFLADEKVVVSYNDVPFYQSLLLQKTNGNQTIYLASNLNYLVTKKRLIMMTKSTSKKIAVLKKIAIVPILAGLVFFICFKIVGQEKTVDNTAVTAVPVNEIKLGNSSNEDKIRDAYYKGVWVKITDQRINQKFSMVYEDLSLEQRRKYLDYVPTMMIEKEIPQPLFDKMKTKNMAVWINGKMSTKEEIRKYKRTDFNYYTYSFVHKNARSKRFPQEYQYTLYTKKYFDENLKNSHLHFSNDTIRIGFANYKTAMKDKVTQQLSSKINADTIAWYTEGKDEYNLYISDAQEKKSKSTTKEIETVATGKEADLKEPHFPGGLPEFYKFIAKNFKTPKGFKSNDKLIVSFIVEKDGSLTNIDVKKDIGSGTKEEAIRVLKISPKWIPATVENKMVRYQYVLPIQLSPK